MILKYQLRTIIQAAFSSLYNYQLDDDQAVWQSTKKGFEGTHTFVTFPWVKILKKNPNQIAEELGKYLVENEDIIKNFNTVQGFLNIELKDEVWSAILLDLSIDFPSNKGGKKVMIEYSSPNTNKPLHLGHLRNNFLGYSIAEILKADGQDVHKTQIINDRGIHICKSMLAYQKWGKEESPESSGLKGDHLIGKYYVLFDQNYKEQIQDLIRQGCEVKEAEKKAPIMLEAQEMLRQWEQGDEKVVGLWKKMNAWVYEGFDITYKKIGVDFDSVDYESNTFLLGKDLVQEGLEKEVFYQKEDGSVWIDLTEDGLDEKLVLRGDGTSVYITQDLGTAQLRFEKYGMDQMVYVVGSEQDYHFKVLLLILKKLGKSFADGIHHLSYGMVDLPSGKMKSREGTVVDADDLVEEMLQTARSKTAELGKIEDLNKEEAETLYHTIALGALKYFLLKVDPKKRIVFNPEESIDLQGDTAAFIQYNYARTASVLRKVKAINYKEIDKTIYPELHAAEINLIQLLYNFPEKINEAALQLAPSIIAQYAYDLAKTFAFFFSELSILKAENEEAKKFRLLLTDKVGQTIQAAMRLLGIDVPQRM